MPYKSKSVNFFIWVSLKKNVVCYLFNFKKTVFVFGYYKIWGYNVIRVDQYLRRIGKVNESLCAQNWHKVTTESVLVFLNYEMPVIIRKSSFKCTCFYARTIIHFCYVLIVNNPLQRRNGKYKHFYLVKHKLRIKKM